MNTCTFQGTPRSSFPPQIGGGTVGEESGSVVRVSRDGCREWSTPVVVGVGGSLLYPLDLGQLNGVSLRPKKTDYVDYWGETDLTV